MFGFPCVVAVVSLAVALVAGTDRVCEPIRIDTCHDIGYNVTGMPNLVGHELQQDAHLQLKTFTPLIQYGCSSRLRFFLCSVYVPMCTEKVPTPIGPCRSLCEDIRDRCQPVLQEFGFLWPAGLNCSKFPPQNNDKHMCMDGPDDQKGPDNNLRIRNRNRRPNIVRTHEMTLSDRKLPFNRGYSQHYGMCKNYRFSEQYYYINRTQKCAPLCSANINFSQENKVFADYWLAAWSGLCFLCTLFNILVVIVGDYRFRYPEGAIVFISGCYNACSIAYLIRLLVGRYEASCHMDPQHSAALLIQEGFVNANCTIIFVVLYFFKMAMDGWWLVLCITWYMSSRLKWRPESLLRYSHYYHMLAWFFPCLMTVIVLVTQVIDADELIGSCYVGNQSTDNLLTYVILPSAFYLGAGVFVLFLFILPAKCAKEDYSHVQTNPLPIRVSENNDAVTSLIGIFMYLYLIPAFCVLGADIYEYIHRDTWLAAGSISRPVVEVFSLKFFMLQIMGVATSFVVGSSDATKRTLQKLSRSILRKKKPVPSYLQVQPSILTASCRSKRSVSSKANSETIL